jgi:hypothetical protein
MANLLVKLTNTLNRTHWNPTLNDYQELFLSAHRYVPIASIERSRVNGNVTETSRGLLREFEQALKFR